MAVPLAKHLWTVEEFQRAAETGAFPPDNRLELIRGELVEMAAIGNRHAICVMLLNDLLGDLKPLGIVNPQNPLRLPRQRSVPQPDVVLLRRRDFRSHPPQPEDVLVLVEVADTSLTYDRETKIPLYAESGIPEAWLVDLNSDTISVYRRPSPKGYQEVRQYRRGDTIMPEAIPEARFAVDDFLP
jgi:Uma2 family endonuclease